ncbi:MAG: zf-HC2 domain-containing protein [Anaeromyxobacter sp.]
MSIEPLNAAMDCTELERSVDAWLDGELDDRDRTEVDRHLEGCPRCRPLADARARLRLATRAKLREAMGPAAAAGAAPPALRARVVTALAKERRPLWRRMLAPVPMATLAACAAGALVVIAMRPDDTLLEEAIAKHHRDLPLEVTTASMAEATLPAWFTGKLDFKPTPPKLEDGGARMIGARLSHLREWPAAYFRYALPRGNAGLFIVDDPSGKFGTAGREVQVGQDTIRLANAKGYNVAVWRQDEIVYSLVSDLDEGDLFKLVRAARADHH